MANEASSSEKKSMSCCSLTPKSTNIFLLELFWIVFACKQCLICAYSLLIQTKHLLHWKKAILWIEDLQFIIALMMDLFLRNRQIFASQDIIDGLEWCGLLMDIVMFLSAVGLSFWRHPFTAEDPLVSKWCNATFLQIWWRKHYLHLGWPEGEYNFNKLKFLGNYSFKSTCPIKPHYEPLEAFTCSSFHLLERTRSFPQIT